MEPKVEAPSGSGMLGLGSDEIRSFDENNSSFTALLELSTPQAVELLLVQEDFPAVKLLPPPPPLPIFPLSKSNNTHLLSTEMVKQELPDSDMDSHHNCLSNHNISVKTNKRKEREKKVKESSKKSKKVVAKEGDGEKLPYVHVRARRGQATDSHSLAERARREKINARMKLLQELVPGCNKISGTAMVLDEIINHVQALQREVEFLSMRLAAVSPNIDFNLDDILATESGYPQIFQSLWHEGQSNGIRQQPPYQQMCHFGELHQESEWGREEDTTRFITPEPSALSYNSSAKSDTSE